MNDKAQQQWLLFIMMICAFCAALPASATNYHHPLDDIKNHVTDFVLDMAYDGFHGEKTVQITALDPRLKLASCNQPLESSLPNGQYRKNHFSVAVRCRGNTPWMIYVPVTVRIYDDVLILKNPVAKNTHITESDVNLARHDVLSLRQGYFQSFEDIVGKVARRNLNVGIVMTPNHLEDAKWVKRGQRVKIIAEINNLTIEAVGKALSDGIKNEMIRVKNIDSDRVINAVVTTPGVVNVPM